MSEHIFVLSNLNGNLVHCWTCVLPAENPNLRRQTSVKSLVLKLQDVRMLYNAFTCITLTLNCLVVLYRYELYVAPKVSGGGGYLGFEVTGIIEWRQKSRPKKIPGASNKISLDQKLTPQNPMPNFLPLIFF